MNKNRFQTFVSQSGRRIFGRLLPDADLIEGIKEICSEHGVSSGSIASAIGSLKVANIVYALPDRSNPIGIRYSDPVVIERPLELLGCQGLIGCDIEGNQNVHLHGVFSDPEMTVLGGHFLDSGNTVLATVELVIQECHDITITREQDKETSFPLFRFYQD